MKRATITVLGCAMIAWPMVSCRSNDVRDRYDPDDNRGNREVISQDEYRHWNEQPWHPPDEPHDIHDEYYDWDHSR